ncbi:ABC transporter permease [Acetobacterium wieringae]|uniref:ABC transporter permease n=1 Tax=Acetobacterium wieringae TaxID=52694 RepID=A0ABY6HG65_9FIRM|nr:ABC transporter permease [Acetobacterium wieringae]UYO62889.1 ABC transporter permease [Acetobacterium wieringae]VUZ26694.1 putative D,D-dipeptide transport system permease protein DdpC [Acetobacterium wieringae]
MKKREFKIPVDAVHKRLYFLLVIVMAMILLSLIAPYLCPNDPNLTDLKLAKLAPSAEYPFGTDSYGRCVFSRVLMGAKVSIFASLALVAGTFIFGTVYGVICGYYGKRVDRTLMGIVDVLLAFPDMILAIAVAGILGGGLINAMIALALTGWTQYARLARSSVMAVKSEAFIQAAQITGNSHSRIMWRHILPNISGPLIVTATLQIGGMMMGIAGLSFLGIGVQIPQAEWGSMINEGRSLMQTAPWVILYPGIVMLIAVMLFNLLGDTVRDLLDPKELEI